MISVLKYDDSVHRMVRDYDTPACVWVTYLVL